MQMQAAGSSAGGATGGVREQPTAGRASGGAPTAEGGASTAEGGASIVEGGALPAEAGAGGWAGEGGATSKPPSTELLIGDYDVFFQPPPPLADCSPDVSEPRLNLALFFGSSRKLEAQQFADYYWDATVSQQPKLSVDTLEVPAALDYEKKPLAPALTLDLDADGVRGTGFAEIPYSCSNGATKTQRMPIRVEVDRTPPKLRIDPVGFTLLGYTRFGFTFSEPVKLPNGDYNDVFSEPSDGQQAVELYDVATSGTLPTAWKWALGGPVSQAHFIDAVSVEGRTIGARLVTPLADRAGNPLTVLGQSFYIQHAAVLDTEIDFDQKPAVGMFDNASYHAAAEPGAECEQGGCLVLDGPVVPCFGAPQSTFAVRLSSPWNTKVQIRYRAWASTSSVSPLEIGYASGCSGTFYTDLSPLPQADGALTHASTWKTVDISPCGGPENEVGFTLSLGCAENAQPPTVRVVLERIRRSQ